MARPSYPSDDIDKLLLRFPPGMRDQIKSDAEKSGRSMNAEIVFRLQESLDKSLDKRLPSEFYGLLTQMQTSVDGADKLFHDLWMAVRDAGITPRYLTSDIDQSILKYGEANGMSREEAIREILIIFLREKGYYPTSST